MFASVLLACLATVAHATNTTHVCLSSFSTDAQLDNFPFSSTTDLIQSISPLTIDAQGAVATLSTWPLKSLTQWAHGNNTRMWAGVRFDSKEDAATFFASPSTQIVHTATQLVNIVTAANYDGLQLDIEGLHFTSKQGYETFVSAVHTASQLQHVRMATTLYVNVLLLKETAPTAYDAKFLSTFGDGIFIMGYDMTWLNLYTHTGRGWQYAGPNSPLDGLNAALQRAIAVSGVDPSQIILGLPAYGRVFTCDGSSKWTAFGNCSCLEKNFKKKSLDIMWNIVEGDNACTHGFDAVSATPYWVCPHGSNTTHANNPQQLRQMGYYENAESFNYKLNLVRKWGVTGVGLWAANGIGGGSTEDAGMWALLEEFV